ncbi:MAG: YkgJ family cysteine cluster protein [Desulfotomaculales bacterium]
MGLNTSFDAELEKQLADGALVELKLDDPFDFICREACMGTCCNRITITLDPWDVEVMARHLGMPGQDFVHAYCSYTWDDQMCWPVLTLRDAAAGPCAFLLADGRCRIYPARSRNCRTYPIGRAVRVEAVNGEKKIRERYFLVDQQKPCQGRLEGAGSTVRDWLEASGAFQYFAFSDLHISLIDYAHRELSARRWLTEATGRVLLPFLFAPDILRIRLGIPEEQVGAEEFYRRRMHALHVLLTDLAAELGYGPGTAGTGAGSTVMDRVREILAYGAA